jgi:uncharacterized protein involved in exopolysaccharide biosynthesis/Mrp family chromosome partitioning ATPase
MLHEQTIEPVADAIRERATLRATRAEEDRINLKELLEVLKRRRASIAWVAAPLVIVALAYAFLATPLYTASTQILVDPRDRQIVKNEVSPGALAPDGGIALVESQLLVITSDTVLRKAIRRAHLDTDPEFGAKSDALLAVLARTAFAAVGLDADAADGNDPELKALRQLKRRIGVKRSEKAFVIDIYVTTNAKDKSVRVADAIAGAYLDDQAEARAQAAGRAAGSLGARLEELRTRVNVAENRVEQYKVEHNILGSSGVLVNEQQLTEINNQLNNARARTAEARARLEQIEMLERSGGEPGAIPEAVQSQTIGQMRVQYAEAVRQRADLGAQLGSRHPSIIALESQVRDLRALIKDELSRIGLSARSDFERARANEQSLERSLDTLKRTAISTNQAFVRLRELEREVEASRAVYEAFLVRARETSEQQTIDTTNSRVITTATPPRDRSWPPRALLAAAALLAGLGLGAGAGLLREYFDDTVRSRRQLQELTGLPVLAAIARPAASTQAVGRVREALREMDRPRRGRSVLVTSSAAGEGKTTFAVDLARVAAAQGERVLLVDADLDGRSASKLFDAERRAGLCDLLEARTILPSVLIGEVVPGVSFLPVGKPTATQTRRPPAGDIVQKLVEPGRSFDLVVIDGGSIALHPYVQPLAEAADDIVLVVRAGRVPKDDILAALEALHINARKIRGTVLTAATGDPA